MTKLYIAILLALIWALVLMKSAGGLETLACYQNYSPSPGLPLKTMVLGMVERAGFDPKVADKILICESNYRSEAIHINKNGTRDVGIWQINDEHGLSTEERMDPYLSTLYAIELMRSSRSYGHWVCFR